MSLYRLQTRNRGEVFVEADSLESACSIWRADYGRYLRHIAGPSAIHQPDDVVFATADFTIEAVELLGDRVLRAAE